MKASKAGKIWLDYHQIHSKKNTVRAHSFVKDRFCRQFGDIDHLDVHEVPIVVISKRNLQIVFDCNVLENLKLDAKAFPAKKIHATLE